MAVVTLNLATTSDSSYITATDDTGADSVHAGQTVSSGLFETSPDNDYNKWRALARWFVNIPADATVNSANFLFRPTSRTTGTAVSLQANYYTHDGTIDISDWDATAGALAFSVLQSTFTLAADNTVALSNISNIPKNGYIGFRFQHSDEIAGLTSSLTWTDGTGSTGPRLQIRYTRVTAPTNLSPTTPFDRTAIQRFSWQHNEGGGGTQGAFTFYHRASGAGSWTTVTQTTSNNYYDMPAATYGSAQDIEWKVKTADQAGDYGPESSVITVRAGNAASTPNITAPTGTITNSQPTATWTSSGQASYRLRVIKVSDSTVKMDTGEVVSVATSKALTITLEDDSQYQFKLSIKNSDGVWSAEDTETITTNLTNPATPSLSLSASASGGYILLTITNPAPSGGQPALTENQVYRKIDGENVFKRIKKALGSSATFRDYGAPSGKTVYYKIRAVGDNGAVADSTEQSTSYTLSGLWLHDVRNAQSTALNLDAFNAQVDDDLQYEVSLKKYLGREGDVAVWGKHTRASFRVSFVIKRDSTDWASFTALVHRRTTLCVRTPVGDVYFGAVQGRPRQFNHTLTAYAVTLDLTGTAFTEEV